MSCAAPPPAGVPARVWRAFSDAAAQSPRVNKWYCATRDDVAGAAENVVALRGSGLIEEAHEKEDLVLDVLMQNYRTRRPPNEYPPRDYSSLSDEAAAELRSLTWMTGVRVTLTFRHSADGKWTESFDNAYQHAVDPDDRKRKRTEYHEPDYVVRDTPDPMDAVRSLEARGYHVFALRFVPLNTDADLDADPDNDLFHPY